MTDEFTSKNHLIGHMAFDVNNKRYEKPFLLHFKSFLFDGFYYLHLAIFLAPISEKNNKNWSMTTSFSVMQKSNKIR